MTSLDLDSIYDRFERDLEKLDSNDLRDWLLFERYGIESKCSYELEAFQPLTFTNLSVQAYDEIDNIQEPLIDSFVSIEVNSSFKLAA